MGRAVRRPSPSTWREGVPRSTGTPRVMSARRSPKGYARNSKLKHQVADLSLDRHILQEIVQKKLKGLAIDASWGGGRKPFSRSVRGGCRG